jgi:hypothetical protein
MKTSTLIPVALIISFFFLFSALEVNAQERFRAGAMLGFNLAQLDGDNFSGYNKTGISGGLRVATVFNDRLEFMVEMLYTQTGSQYRDDGRPQDFTSNVKPVHIRLNFVEVPLMINYRFKPLDRRFYRYEFFAGASIGRLIGNNITEERSISGRTANYGALAEDFNKNQVGILFGLKYNIDENLGLALRHTIAGNRLYELENPDGEPVIQMRSFFFSLHAMYMFDIGY